MRFYGESQSRRVERNQPRLDIFFQPCFCSQASSGLPNAQQNALLISTCTFTTFANYHSTRQLQAGTCSASSNAEQNALRLSLVVRRNLETDTAAGGSREYADATAGAGAADVRLHTPDAEVDFDERASEAGRQRPGIAQLSGIYLHIVSTAAHMAVAALQPAAKLECRDSTDGPACHWLLYVPADTAMVIGHAGTDGSGADPACQRLWTTPQRRTPRMGRNLQS